MKKFFIASGLTDQKINDLRSTLQPDQINRLFLLQTLIIKKISNNPSLTFESYVPISKDELVKIFGYRRKDEFYLLDFLIESEHIERLNYNPYTGEECITGYYNYSSDPSIPNQSKSFRISSKYFIDGKLYRLIPIDKKFLNKINKMVDKINYANLASANDYYKKLVNDSMDEIIILDNEDVKEIVRKNYNGTQERVNNSLSISFETYYNSYVENFNDNIIKPSVVDNFGGRLHHQVTRMKKDLRPHLRFNSAPKEEISFLDIVNSQPYLYSHLSAKLIDLYAPEFKEVKKLLKKYGKEQGFLNFKKHSAAGTIYEEIARLWKLEYGVNIYPQMLFDDNEYKNVLRNNSKDVCYHAFFGDYRYSEWSNKTFDEMEEEVLDANDQRDDKKMIDKLNNIFAKKSIKLFEKHFNGMFKFFKEIKEMNFKHVLSDEYLNRKKYKGSVNNCILIQRVDSGLIFNGIIQHIRKTSNITNIATIHDSIGVPKRNEKELKKLLKEAFKQHGLNPKFK